MKNTIKIFKFMWKGLRKYRFHLVVSFVLFGAMVFLGDALVPVLIKDLTNTLGEGNLSLAKHTLIRLLFLYLIMRLLIFISMHLLAWFESKASRDLHNFSFDHFTKHSYHFYMNAFTGSLISKASRLGENMVSILDNILFNFFPVGVSMVSILVILSYENSRIVVAFFVFIIFYFLLSVWITKKMGPIYEERSRAKSKNTAVISDVLTNIQNVIFFAHRAVDKDIFSKSNEDFYKKRYRAWKMAVNFQDTIGFLPPVFTALITLYTVYLVELGLVSIGSVLLVFLFASNISQNIWRLSNSMKRMISDISDTVEAIEIIERPLDLKDPIAPEKLMIDKGAISFIDVSFNYPQGDEVFEHFNLVIPSGQSVGLVGKSGSGKTTVTKILLRLYDVDKGLISVDNQNISLITQSDLRSSIAYIPQESILFHRTIFENIAYGDPTASEEKVLEAAKSAHVDEFVNNLADGYQTKVGERGVKLSGGQRQRISIARAMLKKDAPILVMDEATSSLDSISEQYIQDSFDTLMDKRTTIVIAHRLSTIQKMDRIIVLDKGVIVEDGTHSNLLEIGGYYSELWKAQKGGMLGE